MQPIRGPIDYNRYPPRKRRRNSATRAAADTPDVSDTPDADAPQDVSTQAPDVVDAATANRRARTTPPRDVSAAGRAAAPRSARRTQRRVALQAPPATPFDETEPADDGEDAHAAAERRREIARQRRRARRGGTPYENEDVYSEAAHGDEPPGPRRASRRRAPRKPLWQRARRWCALLLIALCVECVVAALTAPQFAIKSVQVVGQEITAPESVAAVQSALQGQNWLRARLQAAAGQLETLPTVKQAHVTRDLVWPPRVTVHITERQPFARVGAGSDWWVVDKTGVPFRRVEESNAGDAALYAVTGPTLQPQLGQAIAAKTWEPVRAFAVSLAQAENGGTRWALRRLYFDRHGFASLRLTGGSHDEMLIQMGADRWPEKLQRARRALTYFEATGRRAAVLNLISYSMPTWTPRPEIKQRPSDEVKPGRASNAESSEDASDASASAEDAPEAVASTRDNADGESRAADGDNEATGVEQPAAGEDDVAPRLGT